MLGVVLLVENPSCMEKMMDGRICIWKGRKLGWKKDRIFNLLLWKLSISEAKNLHLYLKVYLFLMSLDLIPKL